MDGWTKNKKMVFEMCAMTILFIAQIVFFILHFGYGRILVLKYLGFALWILSAIFGWLPIHAFRKKGKVPKGKSYVHTTELVTSGVYRVVRHPQFLAGILLSLAFMLISQNWSVLALGIPVILIFYKDIFRADQSNTRKFGEAYASYMKEVPRANFLLGFIRVVKKKMADARNHP